MARPPLAVGTYGSISTRETNGTWTAYARYRDQDGKVRAVTRTATAKTRAVESLKVALRDRQRQSGSDELSPSTKVGVLLDLWIERRRAEGDHLTAATLGTYEQVIRTVIKPAIGELRISELTVGRLEQWMCNEQERRPGRARTARTVMKQALDLASRVDAIPINPMPAVSKPKAKTYRPRALTEDDRMRLRSALAGQRQAGPLSDLFETMLGLGLRIGEALALTVDDLDLDNAICPRVRIAATISIPPGGRMFRQPHTKSGPDSDRYAVPPDWVEEILRRRAEAAGASGLLFATRNDTIISPANARRAWRNIRVAAGLEWLTTHHLRKTTATTVERAYGVATAQQIMDHSDPKITTNHYIETRRNDLPDVREGLAGLRPAGFGESAE